MGKQNTYSWEFKLQMVHLLEKEPTICPKSAGITIWVWHRCAVCQEGREDGLLHIKAVGLRRVQDQAKAELDDEQGMVQQEGFEIGTHRMSR